ncbi:conjugative relaxase domain-containing protein [Gluconacetobacter sacchari DSM 12717]|uniref:Relaxase domain-containing protein n=2 Tax=Gluconacetobacter sacchari TaxID=92759 RepID=A0A7W4I9Y1_9PROT|nr:MobF family relaxase [Gluconacetobacter sacchari]MBB2158976.1 relaxase domain-containing protein [Gluconacetobacter sacchari]GBQ31367.1 conjugative relaxase domain-containing protein [Gluconacetobacter sacchari DSM 12717]
MFTCTPLSDVEYYIESVDESLTDEAAVTAAGEQILAGSGDSPAASSGQKSTTGRKRGDWSGRDRAAYYLDNGTGERPGTWWTNARLQPGQPLPFVMNGTEVDSKDFRNLSMGRDPLTKESIVQHGKKRRVGYDLQFAAPKSVSILWAAGTDIQREKIERAQSQATIFALEYAHKNGLIVTRRGKNGEIKEIPAEIMVAVFQHTTSRPSDPKDTHKPKQGHSRAGDPQLHDHAVLANVCRRADGTTGTLDNFELLRHQQAMGAVYRLALAQGLERELGVTTVKVKRNFRVLGVPQVLEQKFSKRRAAIEAAASKMGIDTEIHREAAANISMATRGSKADMPTRAELRERWDKEMREEGWTRESVWESALAASSIAKDEPKDKQTAFQRALTELTSTESVIEDRRLIGTVLEHHQGRGVTVDHAIEQANAARRSGHLIELTGGVSARTNERFYATPEMIDAEREIVRIALARRGEREFVSRDIVDRAIAGRGTISDEQAALVRHALNRDGVSVVEGSAGTGKSFSLGTAAEAARDVGMRVWVTAPSHQAVSVIAKDTNTDQAQAAVLRSFLNRIADDRHGQAIKLTRNDVVILDEAGMVGTAEMRELLRETARVGAKVILSGDTRQLKPVAPGSPMRLLAETLGAQRIDEIRRQRTDWQRQASRDFAAGDIEKAVRAYDSHGRIVIGEGQELRGRLIGDYLDDVRRNPAGTRMVLARTHNEVRNLNSDLRALLRQEGRIAGDDIEIEALSRGRKPVVGMMALAAGDRIIFGENIKAGQDMIRNNDVAVVRDVCRDNADGQPVVTLVFERGFEVTTRWSDLERLSLAEDNEPDTRPLRVQHAYSVTAHSAQGASVDRAYVLNAAGLDRESLYVGMTRHREDCRLYTDVTRIGLNVRDNRIRRDGVTATISDEGHLEAPDAADRGDVGDAVDRETVVRQIVYEGQQSREKGNAADFVMDRHAWASAPSAQEAVRNDIEMRRVALERIKEAPKSAEERMEALKEAWGNENVPAPDRVAPAEKTMAAVTDGLSAKAAAEAEKVAAEARRRAEAEAARHRAEGMVRGR